MALPPTLIYRFIKHTPEETYSALRENKLLSWLGRLFKSKVIMLIQGVEQKFRDEWKGEGPNTDDYIAETLAKSKYLNKVGKRLAELDEYENS